MIEQAFLFVGKDPAASDGRAPKRPTRIGGLTLPERICHQLAQAGCRKVSLVGPSSIDEVLTSSRKPKIAMEALPWSGLVDALSTQGDELVAAIRSDRLYANSLIDQMLQFDTQGQAALWMDGELQVGLAILSAADLSERLGRQDIGGDGQAEHPALLLGQITDRLVDETKLRLVQPDGFWLPVERPEHIRPATNRLFKSLTKPVDGWVSRNLNRPLSTRVTRLVVNLPVTPHPISFVVFAIGMSSVYFSLKGTYFWMALGGIIFHAASVLDGVDGELARVKFLASKAGALLDSILDHIIEVGYIGGVGWVLTKNTGSPVYFGAFVVTLTCALIGTAIVNYDQATKTKTGAPTDVQFAFNHPDHKDKLWARIIDKIRFLFGRDFYALLFAVLTILDFPYPIPLLAGLATSIYLVVVLVGKVRDIGRATKRANDALES